MDTEDTDTAESTDKTAAQAEMLANRLKKRYRHLRKWARRSNVGAFRLYDRDIPEIPLALDLYDAVAPNAIAALSAAMVSGALYKRPYEKDEAEEVKWLLAMTGAIAKATGLNTDSIIIKQRERQHGEAQYEKIADRGLVREVCEGRLKFKVNLSDYLDTGLFLDRRAMRRAFGDDSKGKRILNLFCYTASFSVHAADGGAASTDSVDLSNTYLGWARDNFALNGFNTEMLRLEEYLARCNTNGNSRNRLIRADVAVFLQRAQAARQRWDSIILDPPVFSNSSMTHNDFDLKRDYENLLAQCLSLLAPGGKLWFSASARSFKAGVAELETALKGRFPGVTVTDIGGKVVDEDFKGRKMPKAFVVEVTP